MGKQKSKNKKEHLDLEDVRHIAQLAQLELDAKEENALLNDLNQILTYFEQIDRLNTRDIEPMSHSISLSNAFAEDKPHAENPHLPQDGLSQEEALANAPNQSAGQVRVPAIIE